MKAMTIIGPLAAVLAFIGSQVFALDVVPTPDAVAAQAAVIKEQIKSQYRESSPKVADALLQSARAERDPVIRYAYLRESIRVSVEIGDSDLALSAVRLLSATYAVITSDEDAAVALALVSTAKTVYAASLAAQFALQTCHAVELAGNQALATRLASAAQSLAARHKDPSLKDYAKEMTGWITEHAQSRATLPTVDLLGEMPATDAVKIGRHLCFLEAKWPEGCAQLKRGSDATLAALATLEEKPKRTVVQTVELADGWWEQSLKAKGSVRSNIQRHAGLLYRSVLDALTGITQTRVGQRLVDLPFDFTASSGSVDLWPLLSLTPGSYKGDWKNQKGDLVVEENSTGDHLTIPVVPLGDYQFETSFTRVGGNDAVMVLVPVPHVGGPLSLNSFIYDRNGGGVSLHRLNDEILRSSDKRITLRAGVRQRFVIEVTGTSTLTIKTWLDGIPALTWSGPATTPMRAHNKAVPTVPGALGLGAWEAKVAFHEARLTMLSGRAGTAAELPANR